MLVKRIEKEPCLLEGQGSEEKPVLLLPEPYLSLAVERDGAPMILRTQRYWEVRDFKHVEVFQVCIYHFGHHFKPPTLSR